jgi:hypothetical protein
VNTALPLPTASGVRPVHRSSWTSIAFVCGVIVLIVGLAYLWVISTFISKAGRAAQEMSESPAMVTAQVLAKENPDWEVLQADSKTREITFRNKKTKEETTISYHDASSGNFSIKGTDGSKLEMKGGQIVISNTHGESTIMGAGETPPPDWVPSYPRVARTDVTLSSVKMGRASGSLSFQTDDSPPQVRDFYSKTLTAAGWRVVDSNQIGSDATKLLMLKMETGEGDSHETFNIMATRKEENDVATNVHVIWEGAKKS